MELKQNILNKLNNYLSRENVVSNSDVISAYDLYVIIYDTLKPLRDARENDEFIKKINDDNTVIKLSKVLKRPKKILEKECVEIYSFFNQVCSEINFKYTNKVETVYKLRDTDTLYVRENLSYKPSKEFLFKYKDEIFKIFRSIEKMDKYFYDEYNRFRDLHNLKFEDNFLKFSIHYGEDGNVLTFLNVLDKEYKIEQSKRIEIDHERLIELNNDEDISDVKREVSIFLTLNQLSIMEKIPIETKDLSEVWQEKIKEKYSNEKSVVRRLK